MTSPAVDPFDAFFTPERLACYRDLHARYPLWCGRWPDAEAAKREASGWTPYVISQDVMKEAPPTYLGFDFRKKASETKLPRVTFHVEDPSVLIPATGDSITFLTDRIDPPILGALPAAAGYVFVPWGSTDRPMHTSAAAQRPEEVYARIAREELSRRRAQIAHHKRLALNAKKSTQREAAGNALQRIWIDIGRCSGVLSPTKGGVQCTLSDEHLGALLDEAKSLCGELVCYSADPATVDAVRELAGAEAALSQKDRELLEWMRRDGKPQALIAETREKKLTQSIDSTLWSQRLSYPMLSRVEIESILDHMGDKTDSRMLSKAASDMLANRLPIRQSTLVNRVARAT